ncbi:MAG TPA: hypothetical protein VMT15_07075 [Bryobacteraceae bacterium]|nr:hypothetical protein [Bryobacteraceae bacterium]
MPRTNFLYHTEAVGLSGHISLPVNETIPLQASIASAIGPGYGKVRVENFRHLDYLRVGSIESHVVSSFSVKDKAHGTLSSVVIDDLNTLNVVTCGRLMTRLTSKHDAGAQGSFILHGTHFDDLRIAGHRIDLDLSVGLFSELSTWDKLNNAYENDPAIRKELDELALFPRKGNKLPTYNGLFACTLARIPKKLPRGMAHAAEHGIYVPHFGTIYAAHYYITATSRRLHMLHVDLGCSVEGCNGFGNSGANGSSLPGGS